MTRIELLYVDGCPGHEPLLARVRQLVAALGAPAVIEQVRIASHADAHAQRFLGSPTLRIGGADVEPGADERCDFGLKCRLYRDGTSVAGSPADGCIAAALRRVSD